MGAIAYGYYGVIARNQARIGSPRKVDRGYRIVTIIPVEGIARSVVVTNSKITCCQSSVEVGAITIAPRSHHHRCRIYNGGYQGIRQGNFRRAFTPRIIVQSIQGIDARSLTRNGAVIYD